jgi:hypothetical protein
MTVTLVFGQMMALPQVGGDVSLAGRRRGAINISTFGSHSRAAWGASRRPYPRAPVRPGADAGQDGEGWPDAQQFWGGE